MRLCRLMGGKGFWPRSLESEMSIAALINLAPLGARVLLDYITLFNRSSWELLSDS